MEQRNTPPNATSSPKTTAVSSVRIATRIASFTAVNKFIFLRAPAAACEAATHERIHTVKQNGRCATFNRRSSSHWWTAPGLRGEGTFLADQSVVQLTLDPKCICFGTSY